MRVCKHCKAPLETPLACSVCGEILFEPGTAAADPFAILGLERAYLVDAALLRKNLLRFTRLVHPDFFATRGDGARKAAEGASAALNAAHEVLRDDAERADWLVRDLDGPDERTERSMPQAFLMEVLEWNEALESARDSALGSPQRAQLERLGAELTARKQQVFTTIAGLLSPLPERAGPKLALVRKELNAARYLERALGEIAALRVAQSLSN